MVKSHNIIQPIYYGAIQHKCRIICMGQPVEEASYSWLPYLKNNGKHCSRTVPKKSTAETVEI